MSEQIERTARDIAAECAALRREHGYSACVADLWPLAAGTPVTAGMYTWDEIEEMLLHKNAAYGDSALSPVRIFSKASPVEQLLVRIDDKLSRMARGHAAGEEVEKDLIGYLVLLRIARRRETTA